MKNEQAVREILIDNTIRLVAEGGFEKATTKAIALSGGNLPGQKMNEVYIYRLFGTKEHLYEIAFENLDKEFMYTLRDAVKAMGSINGDAEEKLEELFYRVWRFVLRNELRCRCYVRYYYSIYFKGASFENHNKLFEVIIQEFTPLFKEEADVKSILHSVLTSLLDFAIRVYNGDLEDNDINTPHIFNVLYCMMMTYFKDGKAKNSTRVLV